MPLRASLAGGDFLRFGDGEREGGDRFRGFDGPGEYEATGGGVGRRTADDSSPTPDMMNCRVCYTTVNSSRLQVLVGMYESREPATSAKVQG